jgi:excisionase family DNA binding protein
MEFCFVYFVYTIIDGSNNHMETVIESPTVQDQRVARESLVLFNKAIDGSQSEGIRIQIQAGDATSRPAQQPPLSVVIPAKALHLLAVILSNMAQGKAISLVPSDAEVTTQQAADRLGMSRPHLVKLLEEGVIPFKKVGSHRRVRLEDLLAYEAGQQTIRTDRLQFLAEQAQALNLGYE